MTKESQQNINIENDEISVKELIFKINEWWVYLLSKWLIIVGFVLLGGTIGFFYARSKKTIYLATTTFVLEDEKSSSGGLGNLAGLASMAGLDLGGSGGGVFQGDNILGLYKSRTMLEQTLLTPIGVNGNRQLLVDRYIEFNDLRKKWIKRSDLEKLDFKKDLIDGELAVIKPNRLRDSILGTIVNDLNKNFLTVFKPDKKLSIIQVDVKSEDEIFSKAFNDELVKNVNKFYISTKTKKTLKNVQILQYKADSVKAMMNGAIYSAAAVSDATPNLNPTRQVQRIAPLQRAQFSSETNKAILSELVKNLEMSKMSLLKEAPLIQVVDSPIYPLQTDKFGFIKGIFIGGLIFGLITVIIFTIKRLVNQ